MKSITQSELLRFTEAELLAWLEQNLRFTVADGGGDK
jgi:hypothetical protein